MTQKELLYLEDAVGHEKNIIAVLTETTNLLEDEELIDYIQDEITIHEETKNDLLKELEEKANE